MPGRAWAASPCAPGEELLRQATARAVLDQLTDRERLVLAWLASPVRTIADRTGLAVSTAGLLKQRVTDRLRTMLADDPDAEATALACRDLAAAELGIDPDRRERGICTGIACLIGWTEHTCAPLINDKDAGRVAAPEASGAATTSMREDDRLRRDTAKRGDTMRINRQPGAVRHG